MIQALHGGSRLDAQAVLLRAAPSSAATTPPRCSPTSRRPSATQRRRLLAAQLRRHLRGPDQRPRGPRRQPQRAGGAPARRDRARPTPSPACTISARQPRSRRRALRRCRSPSAAARSACSSSGAAYAALARGGEAVRCLHAGQIARRSRGAANAGRDGRLDRRDPAPIRWPACAACAGGAVRSAASRRGEDRHQRRLPRRAGAPASRRERTVDVWVGNADGAPTRELSGAIGAGPLFADVMRRAMGDVPSRAPLYDAGAARARRGLPALGRAP